MDQNDLKIKCIGIAYGGSTTVGLESIYERTYPKILENLIDLLGFHSYPFDFQYLIINSSASLLETIICFAKPYYEIP